MHEIVYQNSSLTYFKYGTGQKNMLLFHGFGQDHHAFDSWIEKLTEYTVYGFDLFYHGMSDWKSNAPLEKSDWKKIMEIFFEREKINDFEMAGFSMGGKFVLATLENFPDQVKKIFLLAPDGIKINFWYRLATYPWLTRAVFKSFIFNPNAFYFLLRFLDKFGMVSKYLLRFVVSQMDTEEKRKRVCHTWINFRHLQFAMPKIAGLINRHSISLKMIMGQYDKVIPTKDMHRLLKFVPHGKIQVVDSGHNQLIKKSIELILLK